MLHAKMISSKSALVSDNAIFYFRKKFDAPKGSKLTLNVFADARYKLYINGTFVAQGPCKAYTEFKYYDTLDVSSYLKEGENEIFAVVMQLASIDDVTKDRHLTCLFRTGLLAFALWGDVTGKNGKVLSTITSDDSFEVARENNITLTPAPQCGYVGPNEEVNASKIKKNLKWEKAIELCPVQYDLNTESRYAEMWPWYLKKRPIPMMLHEEAKELKVMDNGVYGADELVCGYVRVKLHGKGKVKLTYAESFWKFDENGNGYKEKRDDETGVIVGDYDVIEVTSKTEYEPFWFRCFRFIKAEIEGDAVIDSISYYGTGYPLEVKEGYDFGREDDNKVWDISVRTLKRCMGESYTDCPHYEQLQYVMDTYLQMIYNIQLTNDDALMRKGIYDFAVSQQYDGVLHSRFPSIKTQLIPTFSFFFIFMIRDHYKRFGDASIITQYLCTMDGIFNWFSDKIGEDGLVQKTHFWNFIDWADTWEDTFGVPTVDADEPIATQSLMFAYSLQQAAYLNDVVGRHSTADEYRLRAQKLIDAVNELCFDEEAGLYANGPHKKYYCQHNQVWAVLCGAATGCRARSIMEKSFELKAQSTFAFAYFLFRALEFVGMYNKSSLMFDKLRGLLDYNCTTVPETPTNPRSECHAWGAIAIYEFTTRVLGVETESIEDKLIRIEPYIENRDSACGPVPTVFGDVFVKWTKKDSKLYLHVESPVGTVKEVFLPSGKSFLTNEAVFNVVENL